ncbi:MAG: DoxX family protein [Balneolaceae bacterium]|nr:DoxX family protein [Balneolaceae bacterium]MCH8547417.1 DoxX family protein [Balneolaceae bacterium]
MNKSLSKYHDLAPLLLRIGVGLIFIFAGWGKLTGIEGTQDFFGNIGIPMAGLMAWVVALVEFVGGLMVLFGAWARIPNLLLAVIMVVALLTTKMGEGFGAARLDLMLLFATLALAIIGSGKYSVDGMTGKS